MKMNFHRMTPSTSYLTLPSPSGPSPVPSLHFFSTARGLLSVTFSPSSLWCPMITVAFVSSFWSVNEMGETQERFLRPSQRV